MTTAPTDERVNSTSISATDMDAPPKKNKKQLMGIGLVNKNVTTVYGVGIVLEFRVADDVYVIKLTQESSYQPLAILYTQDVPIRTKSPQEEADKLNEAYEAMERMRRMNLEMECFEAGVPEVQYDHCTVCLFTKSEDKGSRFPRLQKLVDSANSTTEASSSSAAKTSFPRIRNLWGPSSKDKEQAKKMVVLPRIQKFMDGRQQASAAPCLICASLSCSTHSSANFRKEGITLCLSCERLFELNFIVDCVSTPDAAMRAKHIDHMIDCYDRCLLLLQYSAQYVDQISQTLEQQKEQQNKIGLGSSGVGVLSGVLGIAAAATILTPAGPPLLIASLFFGGSATAVQTGNEAMNYFSEPNKLADRIIALQGMVLSILRVTSTLRDAMLRDHIRTDVFDAEPAPLSNQVQEGFGKKRVGVLATANVGRSLTLGGVTGGVVTAEVGVVAGAEAGAVAGARGATAFSRSATAAARTIRIARFAGGALSAAVLVMEANAIQSTLKSIQEGSPCDKAERIRQIAKEVKELPSTAALDEECQAYLTALASRPTPPIDVAAEATDAAADEFPEAECKMAPIMVSSGEVMANSSSASASASAIAVAPGVLIIDGDAAMAVPASQNSNTSASSSLSSSLMGASSSFLQAFQPVRSQQRQPRPSTQADEVVAVVEENDRVGESELNLVV